MTILFTSDVSDHTHEATPVGVQANMVGEDSLEASSLNLSMAGLAALSSALLAACGGGGGGGSSADPGAPGASASTPGFNNFPQAKTDEEAARFLQQSQFASTPTDIAAVRSTNFANYLQQQFSKPQTRGWDWLDARGYGSDTAVDKNVYNSSIADFMVWRNLISAPDAMRQRVAFALSEIFVVSFGSMEIDWRGYTMTAYWDLLAEHAFGNFRNLLEAITLNPAMGYYLNTRGNQKADGKGRLPDENYAREVMQLFTIGLYELNANGTYKVDASGKRIETYDSDDVSQLARIFTGYDFDPAYKDKATHPNNGKPYSVWGREYARTPMKLDTTKHSIEPVSFLNVNITSTSGPARLKAALDGLFNHPNVGPFIGRQLIQRLVTSNPSQQYVERVSRAFNNNGAGVRGDMKAVLIAVLLDDEARGSSGLTDSSFGKLREPVLRFVQWSRSFGAVSKADSWKIFDLSNPSNDLGQSPLHSPSVFNFFRPGYVPPGTEMAKSGATAPEFQIVNETTVGGYLNFMQNVIRDGLFTPNPETPDVLYTNYIRTDFFGDYTSWLAMINNTQSTDAESLRIAQSITSKLNLLLCAGQLSNVTLTEIINTVKTIMTQKKMISTSPENDRRNLLSAAILMIMGSPDYLIQK